MEEAVKTLRDWAVRERGGKLQGGDISLFYDRYPQHRRHLQGSLVATLKKYPWLVRVKHEGANGVLLLTASTVPLPTREKTAELLHRWVVAKGGIISVGDLGQFYQMHQGTETFVKKKLGKFVNEFPTLFELRQSDLRGQFLHSRPLDVTAMPVQPSTDAKPNDQEEAAKLLWSWVFKQPAHRISSGVLSQFYIAQPAAARQIRGKLRILVARYPHLFATVDGRYYIAKDQGDMSNATTAETSLRTARRATSTQSAADVLYQWLLRQPDQAVFTSALSMFRQAHPSAFESMGKLKSFIAKHPSMFELEQVTDNIQRLVAVLPRGGRSMHPKPTSPNGPSSNGASTNGGSSSANGASSSKGTSSNGTSANGASRTSMPDPPKPAIGLRRALEADGDGIRILPDPATVSHERNITRLPVTFKIVNFSQNVGHTLIKVEMSDPRVRRPVTPIQMQAQMVGNLPVRIPPQHRASLEVVWRADCPAGKVQLHLVHVRFHFAGGFSISRFIALNAGGGADAHLIDEARAKTEYFPHKIVEDRLVFEADDKLQYPRIFISSQQLFVRFPRFQRVPVDYHWFYMPFQNDHIVYFNRFALLLQMTMDWERKELEHQDLRNVRAIQYQNKSRQYIFSVPGLAEKRPSVLLGDRTKAMEAFRFSLPATATKTMSSTTPASNCECYVCHQVGHIARDCPYSRLVSDTSKTVGGTVVQVFQTEIVVEFYEPLKFASEIHLRFIPNEYSFKMQSLALHAAVRNHRVMDRLLRPQHQPTPSGGGSFFTRLSGALSSMMTREVDVNTLRPCLRLNPMQLSAVNTVVNEMTLKSGRTAPFLLFGPPGTGKTTTLVAAVASILLVDGNAKILVSAGSNSACDVFFDKLRMELGAVKMERFVAAHLEKSRPSLVPQSLQDLEKARVIVATCVASGKLSMLQGRSFTHVFVDEAAQSTETETLIPLCLCGPDAQWVLGGDHKQLGPVIRCMDAEKIGRFDVSLFERIMATHPKYERELDPQYAVLLTNNYRSHPGLLTVPSQLFYLNRLVPCATGVSSLCTAMRGGFPVIAHHITGKEEREGSSPSWFNLAEVHQVLLCVRQLHQEIAPRTHPPLKVSDDVIVIAPYAGQVRKIRAVLHGAGFGQVKVDSVEKFQGGEARVVIISTARSSSIMDDYDAMYHLGFLKNAKRFNVAITRAREFMVLVGNMVMLKEDPNWKALVVDCERNNAIVGL